jgi:predicted nucleotidyltransferase
MKQIEQICKKYNVILCYLFGSQKKEGKALLQGDHGELKAMESDIDFAVLFKTPPQNNREVYAALSLDLQDLVSPFKADLLF